MSVSVGESCKHPRASKILKPEDGNKTVMDTTNVRDIRTMVLNQGQLYLPEDIRQHLQTFFIVMRVIHLKASST